MEEAPPSWGFALLFLFSWRWSSQRRKALSASTSTCVKWLTRQGTSYVVWLQGITAPEPHASSTFLFHKHRPALIFFFLFFVIDITKMIKRITYWISSILLHDMSIHSCIPFFTFSIRSNSLLDDTTDQNSAMDLYIPWNRKTHFQTSKQSTLPVNSTQTCKISIVQTNMMLAVFYMPLLRTQVHDTRSRNTPPYVRVSPSKMDAVPPTSTQLNTEGLVVALLTWTSSTSSFRSRMSSFSFRDASLLFVVASAHTHILHCQHQ